MKYEYYILLIMKNIRNKETEFIFEIYFKWKELNFLIKKHYTRGVNLHEAITEHLVCILNDYELHASSGGSEDAITKDNKKVQIKATSNFDRDLTSFGPKSKFDILEFLRLDLENDKFYCYKIPIDNLNNIKVNELETFNEKQLLGQRPRFSIIDKIIIDDAYNYYAVIDMNTGDVEFFD